MLEHLSERINVNGWRAVSNHGREAEVPDEELKEMIRWMRRQRCEAGRHVMEEAEPPEAA